MPQALIRAIGVIAICCTVASGAARADDAGDINRLFSTGHVQEAFSRLDKLIAERPRDPQLRFQKGVLLVEAQRGDEAATVFQQLIADYPDIPEPYNNLAVIHASQGQYDKARVALESALRANPAYAAAHQNLGDIYAQLARLAYAEALRLEPSNAVVPRKLALMRDIVTPVDRAQSAPAASR